MFFDDQPERLTVRIIAVQLHIKGGAMHRDILALKL